MKHEHPELFARLSLDELVLFIGLPDGLKVLLSSCVPVAAIRAAMSEIDRERGRKAADQNERANWSSSMTMTPEQVRSHVWPELHVVNGTIVRLLLSGRPLPAHLREVQARLMSMLHANQRAKGQPGPMEVS